MIQGSLSSGAKNSCQQTLTARVFQSRNPQPLLIPSHALSDALEETELGAAGGREGKTGFLEPSDHPRGRHRARSTRAWGPRASPLPASTSTSNKPFPVGEG